MNLIEKNNFIEFLKSEFGINCAPQAGNNNFKNSKLFHKSNSSQEQILNTILNIKFDNAEKPSKGEIITVEHADDIEDKRVASWQNNYTSTRNNLFNNSFKIKTKTKDPKADYSNFINKLESLSLQAAVVSFILLFCYANASSLVISKSKLASAIIKTTDYPFSIFKADQNLSKTEPGQMAINYEIDKSILSDYIKKIVRN